MLNRLHMDAHTHTRIVMWTGYSEVFFRNYVKISVKRQPLCFCFFRDFSPAFHFSYPVLVFLLWLAY